jgi:hypothetical protein
LTDVFTALKAVLVRNAGQLAVKTDTPANYTLVTQRPSPFPQHKGNPLEFGAVKAGKAYVSFHLMPLYMNDKLTASISSGLKKRMQGKSCFNFNAVPEPALMAELEQLTGAALNHWRKQNWL